LFGRRPNADAFGRFPELQKRFFKLFTPWVNEQLACIHDFLIDHLMVVCDAHHIFSEDDDDFADAIEFYQRNYLSLGLEWLRTILDTENSTKTGIRNLLESNKTPCTRFLKDIALLEKDKEQFEIWRSDEFANENDNDKGPREIWLAVYDDNLGFFKDYRYSVWHRTWGYCFWDQERLIRVLQGDIGKQIKSLEECMEDISQSMEGIAQ
jgi:hypothetical protein